jgi:hypothetical protein
MSSENRAPWTTPVLDQLSVDLDAIAAKSGTGKDGGAKGSNKS